MPTRLRTAIVLLTIAGVAGMWLVAAPFVIGYQPTGAGWVDATAHQVVTGAGLIAVTLTAALTIIGAALPTLDRTDDGSPVEDPDAPRRRSDAA